MLNAQENFQRELAQQSIHYRVDDAMRSGISPLVALGAPTYSAPATVSNVQPNVGGSYSGGGSDFRGLQAMGMGLGDLGRSITAHDQAEAQLQFAHTMQSAQLDQINADIGLKGAQAAYWAKKAQEPSFPMAYSRVGGLSGQGQVKDDSGVYRIKAPELTAGDPRNAGTVSGPPSPADQIYVTKEGWLEVQPASGSPASQGDIANSFLNAARNRLLPDLNNPIIMQKMRQVHPDAVGYKMAGGYYVPVYPEEQVRSDVSRAHIWNYIKPWETQ